MQCYRELARVTLAPGLGVGDDRSRAAELINVNATDNHNFRSLLHNTMYPVRETRPPIYSPMVSKLHWLLGGAMTLLTLFVFRRQTDKDCPSIFLFGGALLVVMLMICPVTHLHYFCFLIPLTMFLAHHFGGDRIAWNGMTALLAIVVFTAVLLEQLPGLSLLRDLCLADYAALFLWATACCKGCRGYKCYRGNYLSNGFAGSSFSNYSCLANEAVGSSDGYREQVQASRSDRNAFHPRKGKIPAKG
jgi:hypothetical protein